jgi:hypothetical protein
VRGQAPGGFCLSAQSAKGLQMQMQMQLQACAAVNAEVGELLLSAVLPSAGPVGDESIDVVRNLINRRDDTVFRTPKYESSRRFISG